MAIVTATIDATLTGPQQVSVTLPASTGSLSSLNSLTDVNVTTLLDGALLQYNITTGKWVSLNDIITDTGGNLFLNCGIY